MSRDSDPDQPSDSAPPRADASHRALPKLPPSPAPPSRSPLPPARVTIWTTPAIASDPYSTLPGPRRISMRSTLSVVSEPKS